MPQAFPRRADIDCVRIAAFALLILYHVGLVYAPWDWHVHSAHTMESLRYVVLAANPWRLTLLFLVSGAALALMARAHTPGATMRARLARLVPALAFGVLVLVPPQAWIEAIDKGAWDAGLIAWWLAAFSPEGLARGVALNHLWFVLYIAVYSALALGLSARPRLLAAAQAWTARWLIGWRLFVLPLAYFMACRALLYGWFGLSNQIHYDWYNHAISLGAFLLGFLIANNDAVWRGFERLRWTGLVVAVAAAAALMALEGLPADGAFYARGAVFAIVQWAAIVAVLGFASAHLRGTDGPVLRYLSAAVFPCYLAHQTILVIAAHLLKPLALPLASEAAILLGITLAGSLLTFEIVRRIAPLQPLWGVKPTRPSQRRAREAAPAAAD